MNALSYVFLRLRILWKKSSIAHRKMVEKQVARIRTKVLVTIPGYAYSTMVQSLPTI